MHWFTLIFMNVANIVHPGRPSDERLARSWTQ